MMSIARGAALAAALTIISASAGFAADGGMDDGMAWTLNPGGNYTTMKLTSLGMKEVMKNAKALPGGVVIFRNQGKLYMVEDPKGTLYQMLRDKNMSGS